MRSKISYYCDPERLPADEAVELLKSATQVTFRPDQFGSGKSVVEASGFRPHKVRLRGRPGYGSIRIGGQRQKDLVSARVFTNNVGNTTMVLEFKGQPTEYLWDSENQRRIEESAEDQYQRYFVELREVIQRGGFDDSPQTEYLRTLLDMLWHQLDADARTRVGQYLEEYDRGHD